MSDKIDRPAHYLAGDVECAEVIQALSSPEQWRHFCVMTAFAYLWRHGRKDGEPAEDDIGKALRWLEIALGRDEEDDESRQWQNKLSEMQKQRDEQCTKAEKWKMALQESLAELRKRAIERDVARRQVVELTKQLADAGSRRVQEDEQCHG